MAWIKIITSRLGPAFCPEIIAAGLGGYAISWETSGQSGTVVYQDDVNKNGIDAAQVVTLEGVIAVHNPDAPAPSNNEDVMRDFVVNEAAAAKLLNPAQRRVWCLSQECETMLDYIAELGQEGL